MRVRRLPMGKVSRPFLSQNDLLNFAGNAQMWHTRPSVLLDIKDPMMAYQIDSACAYQWDEFLRKQNRMREIENNAG